MAKSGDPEKTIDGLIIQQTKVYGRIENSLVKEADFGTHYDFEAVIPSEDQFYKDVNQIYKNLLGHDVSPHGIHVHRNEQAAGFAICGS